MLARHKLHAAETQPVLVLFYVVKLDKAVAPKAAVKSQVHEVVEPLLAEQCGAFLILLSVLADQAELLLQCLALPLPDAAGQVQVDKAVGINVVQPRPVGRVITYRLLPSRPPSGDILFREAVGLLHELGCQLDALLALHERASRSTSFCEGRREKICLKPFIISIQKPVKNPLNGIYQSYLFAGIDPYRTGLCASVSPSQLTYVGKSGEALLACTSFSHLTASLYRHSLRSCPMFCGSLCTISHSEMFTAHCTSVGLRSSPSAAKSLVHVVAVARIGAYLFQGGTFCRLPVLRLQSANLLELEVVAYAFIVVLGYEHSASSFRVCHVDGQLFGFIGRETF